ncbi:MAG: response regulator [bacterium]
MTKERILIVEDEVLIAKGLKVKLENQGYGVCAMASSGGEAIQKVEELKPDLVLMDIVINGAIDGIEAANQIRARFGIPIIYLTAYSGKDVLDRAKITEPFGYLLKPFEDQELFANIEMALYKARMEARLRKNEEELRKYRLHLEDLVKDRTNELTIANKQLQQEISERKRAEETLRESEAKYATLVEQAKDGVAVVQDGIYKFVNQAMAALTGYTVEELKGKHLLAIVAPDYKDSVAQRYTLRMAGEKVPSLYEAKFQRKDGTMKDVEISAALITYDGNPADMLIVRDVTEHKKMEEELQKVEKLESVGILAGGIAHDFNNLLAAIIGNLSLAEVYFTSGKDVLEVLERAKKAGQQATKLTQQLLTFAKGGAPIKKPASIPELLEDTVSFALRGSQVRAEFRIADDLWPVEIDEGQISQVISNLVINANQAMPKGGVIRICAENILVDAHDRLPLEAGRYIKISVKDQGVGIPEGYLSRIFEPYFTTKQEGSGLGLSICYSIMKQHEGYITVESQVGIGTTFYLYIPAVEKGVFKKEKTIEKSLLLGKGKILVMDDEEMVRNVAGQMLIQLGYVIEYARDGAEAIELYKTAKEAGAPFDVVVLDLTVSGGIGGKEALEEMCKIDQQVKAIISSGYSNDPVMSKYKKHGFSGVVAKPYEMEELSRIVHKVVYGAGSSGLCARAGEKSSPVQGIW